MKYHLLRVALIELIDVEKLSNIALILLTTQSLCYGAHRKGCK